MKGSTVHRTALSALVVTFMLAPVAAPADPGTLDDAQVTQSFAARFDLGSPTRQIRVTGTVFGSAAAAFIPPNVPGAAYDLTFSGCVQLRRGEALTVRDESCGEWMMIADPTLTTGVFMGQLPSDEGTMTALVHFTGTGAPNEPQPVVTIPPITTVHATLLRPATAVGFVQNDQGEGMAPGELGIDENALMTQIVKANSFVFAP